MGELLLHYPADRLAELYTNDRPLDMIDCSYFLLSDAMLLDHAKHLKKPGEERHYVKEASTGFDSRSSVRKNPFTCLLRDSLWRSGHWKSEKLWSWLDSFHPDIVLLQPVDMKDPSSLEKSNADVQTSLLLLKDFYKKNKPDAIDNGFLDALVFMRYGIGFTTRMCLSKQKNSHLIIRESKIGRAHV